MRSNKATYSGFKFEMDGHTALAVINSDLKKMEDRFDYRYSVFIRIFPEVFNGEGQAEDAEFEYLLEIEKKMIEHLETETETVHVGHITMYGKREIIFYTKKPEPVNDFLNYFLPTIEREHSFEIEPDREWESVALFYEQL